MLFNFYFAPWATKTKEMAYLIKVISLFNKL